MSLRFVPAVSIIFQRLACSQATPSYSQGRKDNSWFTFSWQIWFTTTRGLYLVRELCMKYHFSQRRTCKNLMSLHRTTKTDIYTSPSIQNKSSVLRLFQPWREKTILGTLARVVQNLGNVRSFITDTLFYIWSLSAAVPFLGDESIKNAVRLTFSTSYLARSKWLPLRLSRGTSI